VSKFRRPDALLSAGSANFATWLIYPGKLYYFNPPGSGGELRRSVFSMPKPITVLIADDNHHIRESLHVLLAPLENMKLIGEACNGEEAIVQAAELNPDIILMDINMSPVNGFEATRKILKQNPAIKIIGLSLHVEASYCRNMLRLGARGYVTKSSPYTEIITAINEVYEGGKYIDKKITGIII
jgi:two-component system invasion response regulator UvrY